MKRFEEPPFEEPPEITVDSCNNENGQIEMAVTLPDGSQVFAYEELERSFSEDGDYLIMTKTLGGEGCTKIMVDGVVVCSQVGETIILKCMYSLADRTVQERAPFFDIYPYY